MAKVETKAKLKVEAKVKDNDLATGNFLLCCVLFCVVLFCSALCWFVLCWYIT